MQTGVCRKQTCKEECGAVCAGGVQANETEKWLEAKVGKKVGV